MSRDKTLTAKIGVCGVMVLAILLGPATAAWGQDVHRYVDASAPGPSHNGLSWQSAYLNLQDALDDVTGTAHFQIHVAEGVYRPDQGDNVVLNDRAASFVLKNDMELLGGYPSGGGVRDWRTHPTILSGNINQPLLSGDNSYHVVTTSGTDHSCRLEGFIIAHGSASLKSSQLEGGGLYNDGGSLRIYECAFVDNYASSFGGGMMNRNGANPLIQWCDFKENQANGGAGMYNLDSSPTLEYVRFLGNEATGTNAAGGGIVNGGASGPTLYNCIFSGNTAETYGGAVHSWTGCDPTFINCTFWANSGGYRGGAVRDYASTTTMVNCIAWGNTAQQGAQIALAVGSVLTVNYCDLQGGVGGVYLEGGSTIAGNVGNISADPQFLDPDGRNNLTGDEDDNLRPSPGASCNDAGDNTVVPDPAYASVNTDIERYGRFTNDPARADSGNGVPPIVDMGAYEQIRPLFVDKDATGTDDGSSWANAFNHLQDALALTTLMQFQREVIWVAEGVYKPDEDHDNPTGNNIRERSFPLYQGIAIYGGFAGTETSLSQRDWRTHETILSGEIRTGSIYDNTIHVVYGWGCDEHSALDGFIIERGFAYSELTGENSPEWRGGGIHIVWGSPQIRNCVFRTNRAERHGGGIYVSTNGRPVIANCVFNDNFARVSLDPYLEGYGGGIYATEAYPVIANCTFVGNKADLDGGGLYARYGLATVSNSVFWGNTAGSGTQDVERRQIHGTAGSLTVSYSCIQGLDAFTGNGNIDGDPLFVGADPGPDGEPGNYDDVYTDVRLGFGSPCIDAGDNDAVPSDVNDIDEDLDVSEPIMVDLFGRERFLDDPNTDPDSGDPGSAGPPVVDMGAYEYRPPIHVDADAPGNNDGTTWEHAYLDLQDGLAAAGPGDTIMVAQGTYHPGVSRSDSFVLKNDVRVLGGYAGYGEADPYDRDGTHYPTILSGDLNGDDQPGFVNYGDNSYHVVEASGTDATAWLDAFIVESGNADGANPYHRGGGIHMITGSPTVTECIVRNNKANYAGGLYSREGSHPAITRCSFLNNMATFDVGAIAASNDCSATISDCRFESNTSAGYGGAFQSYSGGQPVVERCTFIDNSAADGGAVAARLGSTCMISNCTFLHNSASGKGGAIFGIGSVLELSNSLVNGNQAADGGGYYGDGDTSTMVNCTITHNTASGRGGGIRLITSGHASLDNSIVWGNSAPLGPQIALYNSAQIEISYSDVEGGQSEILEETGGHVAWDVTSIDLDPRFVDARGADGTPGTEDDNLHLSAVSPCIEAGDPAGNYVDQTDIDGEDRVFLSRVDMGADELHDSTDCNNNGTIDLLELINATSEDCNDNGVIDECEAFPATLFQNDTLHADSVFTGPPDDVYGGIGGQIVVFDFGLGRVLDEAGADFNIYELDGGVIEFSSIRVYVSDDGIHFQDVTASEAAVVRIPGDDLYHQDDNYARSYDLAGTALSSARFVMIDGNGSDPGSGNTGFDLDAIGAIHYIPAGCGDVTFTDVSAGLTGVSSGPVAWGDYDNDGDLDLVMAGYTGSSQLATIYRNDSGAFADIGAGLTGVSSAAAAWGDYDNDGDLDLAIAGASGGGLVSQIHRNDGGLFTNIEAGLTGVLACSLAWGDYDNDGDLDLAVAGHAINNAVSKVYRNDAGLFTDIGANLAGVYVSSLAWGDYDNDGDLDLALAGLSTGGPVSRIYRNDGGTFANAGANLAGVYASSLAWGDYDNDGDLDLALAGFTGSTPVSKIYQNSAGSFTDIGAGLTGAVGSLAWGDYDNDGDLDLALAGEDSSSQPISQVYRNDGGEFTDIGAVLTSVNQCSVAWGDYDNDGDLDLALAGSTASGEYVSKIYRNEGGVFNSSPTAPTALSAAAGNPGEITFSWSAASDAQTPVAGLSYNLRVGTTPGGQDVFCGMANLSSGWRRIPATGNAQKRLSWTLKDLCGTFYWSVQAVDTAFAGSAWAAETSIVVPFAPPDFDQDCDVDADDLAIFEACASGPAIPHNGTETCQQADFDSDADVDQADFAIFQRCLSGPDVPADPKCAE
ncbi:MAG: VCBS repeat-containing protein [Sedimentisphaerales bacterium]|nr:VCBS repeat-containing protein [Sedimentisphaerales bacterium]